MSGGTRSLEEVVRDNDNLREQQRAVSDVLRTLARFQGLQPVLDAVVAVANRLCHGVSTGLWLADGELFRAAALIAKPEHVEYERAHPHVPEPHSLTGRVLMARKPVHIPDVLADPEYDWASQSVAGFRAMVGVPIFVDDDMIGVLAVTRPVPQPFTDEEIRLLTTFADQAAIAIANARLIDAVEQKLDQQRAVADVLRAVARSEGLQPVLDEIVESATRLCAGDNGRLWLLKDGLLHAFANWGLAEEYEYDREHPHAVDGSTLAGRAALIREPVHIPDVEADPEYSYDGPRPYRAALSVPIVLEDELMGTIGIVRMQPEPFAAGHIALVQTFADQAAIAIANARLLEAVERQRTELARFVSPQVAELLSSDEGERLLAGHRAYISVLFCDLRGFTAFVETAAPEEQFEVLRDYHTLIGDLIASHGATLEHFAGDGVMAFFNDPAPLPDHELQAVRMALALRERFHTLADRWRKRGIGLGIGVGIGAGYATLGRIGFDGRYDYGALGPVTNLASRLSTQAAGDEILVDQRIFAAVEDAVDAQPVGELELKGFGRPVTAYAVREIR